MNRETDLILIMGVSGCGKSTVGMGLAERLGGVFLEGDDFHPPHNKQLMGAGIPLTDKERWPWFDNLRDEIEKALANSDKRPVILSSSALKPEYRRYLLRGYENRCRLVFLRGDFDLIHGRMQARQHEYMPASLLESQFATLVEPGDDEEALVLGIESPIEEIISELENVFRV
ncbi:MAG: gluconokinase [Verrucomicrobiae bacterium]|nr:gluconokinase [Verrucomicrobiae bacterium]